MTTFLYRGAIVAIIVWTAFMIIDTIWAIDQLRQTISMETAALSADSARIFANSAWTAFWATAFMSRSIVWGIPTIVFCLIAILAQLSRMGLRQEPSEAAEAARGDSQHLAERQPYLSGHSSSSP